jgi:hypothetical protein
MTSESVANRNRPYSLNHETWDECEKGDLSTVNGWNTSDDDYPINRYLSLST